MSCIAWSVSSEVLIWRASGYESSVRASSSKHSLMLAPRGQDLLQQQFSVTCRCKEAIEAASAASSSSASLYSSTAAARRLGLHYLTRYFFLITFQVAIFCCILGLPQSPSVDSLHPLQLRPPISRGTQLGRALL